MALRDLLVLVDDTRGCGARIDLAVGLAREHDAHLLGLYATSAPELPPMVAAYFPPEVLAEVAERQREAARAAAELFRARSAELGARAEWREVQGPAPATALQHIRHVDLAVAGQAAGGADAGPEDHVVESLVLASPRPLLLVPSAGAPAQVPRRVLVAWDAGAEAARAVHDALPLLAAASRVTILGVNPGAASAGGEYPTSRLAAHLARQGVKAEPEHHFAEAGGVGEALLEQAVARGAELLVMGAWGHSRLRELALGGATRHVLRHMHLPVLLQH